MVTFAIPFPAFDPVALAIGPFALRWYALAYIGGLILGWWYARRLAAQAPLWRDTPRPTAEHLDDIILYVALGIVLGGRLGFVLFYNFDYYLQHPTEIVQVWRGGMAFHGGLAGAALAIFLFARAKGLSALALFDLGCVVAPIGLLLGRIANFINGELWGRVTDVSWGVVFPGGGPLPRHPSQLYEAALEGVVLFAIMGLAARHVGFHRPGRLAGLFGIGYALARITVEFVREPDPQLGFLFGGWLTMGMVLSLPMLALGLWLMRRARPAAHTAADGGTSRR